MLKIRMMSDIHLCFESYRNGVRHKPGNYDYFSVPELPEDSNTVLVLAGDVGVISSSYTIVPFIEEMCARFKAVIYIPGNHEYYNGSFSGSFEKLQILLAHTNAYVLNDESVNIEGVTFICSTLWTDFEKCNPSSMLTAKLGMNDYRVIRTGSKNDHYVRKLDPMDTASAHRTSRMFIENELSRVKIADGGKAVVVTHHLPSFKSVHPMFHKDNNNGAYYSDLDAVFADYSPDLWIHGHTHCSMDYMLYQTRVICNPRGYTPTDLNIDFDPYIVIEV